MRRQGFSLVGGVDEAGRGPWAGPVVAAAVILRQDKFRGRIDDSKRLTAARRQEAYCEIMRSCYVGIGLVAAEIVDVLNILKATALAMENAVYRCREHLGRGRDVAFLVDGRDIGLKGRCLFKYIVGGDGYSLSIAAASIVAKVYRDRIMRIYDRVYPGYGFARHKGYGTAGHRLRLNTLGLSDIHRRTFTTIPK